MAMQWHTKATRYANPQPTKSAEGAQWMRKQEKSDTAAKSNLTNNGSINRDKDALL